MWDIKSILYIVVVIILLLIIYQYILKDVNTMTGLSTAKNMQTIQPNDLATYSFAGNSVNFTYSIWFYIDDWNYRYGEPKILFGRMTGMGDELEPCPSVALSPIQNDLVVSLAVYPGNDDDSTETTVHKCSVSNVPIQRWTNLLISSYGRTLDLYIDGKLVRTCLMPGVPKIDSSAPVYITPNGGFSGWTSRFQYWPSSTNPQKAWDIYKTGYGGSMLGQLFGRYSMKFSIMDGNMESSSWTI